MLAGGTLEIEDYALENEPIQSKLFNGRLDWRNSEVVWFHLYEVKDQPAKPVEVLQLLINDGQLYFNLTDNETS